MNRVKISEGAQILVRKQVATPILNRNRRLHSRNKEQQPSQESKSQSTIQTKNCSVQNEQQPRHQPSKEIRKCRRNSFGTALTERIGQNLGTSHGNLDRREEATRAASPLPIMRDALLGVHIVVVALAAEGGMRSDSSGG